MLKIKHNIGTAVSVGLVVGKNEETGDEVLQEEIFLPGAVLPDNVSSIFLESFADGDDHAHSLVEEVDGDSPKSKKAPAKRTTKAKQEKAEEVKDEEDDAVQDDGDNPFVK